jgi:hypothetical protein
LTATIEEATKKEDKSYLQKLWVPIVLGLGFLVGEAISYGTAMPQPEGGMDMFGGRFHQFPSDPAFGYHVIFTTMQVALLIALVVIYGKMYLETKANFALGLVFVLIALLVQALLSNPVLEDLIITPAVGPGYLTPTADVFTICAYTVFLYLSLD